MLNHSHRAYWTLALLATAFLGAPLVRADDTRVGEQIFKSDCARCHGPKGEGTKRHKRRLEGDRSLAQLTDLIHKTMPEDGPGTLTKTEAGAVAAYVHSAFYSSLARERNRPARVELSRLTVRQYRQAVADLVGGFRTARKTSDERGLKAAYFKGRQGRRGGGPVLERVDPQVAFDFGTASPIAEKIPPEAFSIRWTGSLLANQTGEHEIIVRTEHAAKLMLNDPQKLLIDAWVKSGKDTEYKATIHLVAGRAYPLTLEYSKATQGVDDSKKKKDKKPPEKSSIFLLWKPPGRAPEPVPARNLSPMDAAEVYVCATPFPPDDRSTGWERGTAISKEWDQATTDAALDAAGYVAAHANELAGLGGTFRRRGAGSGNPASIDLDGPKGEKAAPDRDAKLRAFGLALAERAFRRPLTPAQSAAVARQFAKGADPEAGVKRVALFALKSPWFLYREVSGGQSSYDVASRLSFGLWDSLPDKELLESARANKLSTKEEIARQAERMLADPRGKAKLREFLLTWLKADHGLDLMKEAKHFPGFDAAVISDLRTSLELGIDDVLWSEKSDYRQLLLGEDLFLNPRLAKFYGAQLPDAKDEFKPVKLDSGRRAGVLSHPYLMTSFSHSGESSPIHRGVFLARGMLGLALRPPPEAVAPLAPELHPKLTTRQRVTMQTNPAACMTCHAVINPLGFTLEHFDAVGRFREKDKEKPIDATGYYTGRDGKTASVRGARELAIYLANSPEAHAAFVQQMFHHLVQQPMQAYGPNTAEELLRGFAADEYHIRKLAVRVMVATALSSGHRPEMSSRSHVP